MLILWGPKELRTKIHVMSFLPSAISQTFNGCLSCWLDWLRSMDRALCSVIAKVRFNSQASLIFFRFFFNCLQVKVDHFYCKDHVHFHNIYWLNMFLIKKPLKHLSLLRCYTDSKFSGERDISKHREKYISCHRRCTYDFIVLEAEFKFPKSHVCWCASVICLA